MTASEATAMIGGGLGRAGRRRAEISQLAGLVGVVAVVCVLAVVSLDRGGVQGVSGAIVAVEKPPAPTAERPWGVDFDIKYVMADRQWQISNLVLHPPPPPPKPPAKPPVPMYKPTFPMGELKTLESAQKMVDEKLADKNTDPALKEALEKGLEQKDSALEAAIGCDEGSQPGAKIKTACPGMGSGDAAPIKRQWNMGFPPKTGSSAQEASTYKRRGLTPGDVDRGDDREKKEEGEKKGK